MEQPDHTIVSAFNVEFWLEHAMNPEEAIRFMSRLPSEVLNPNRLMLNGAGDKVWCITSAVDFASGSTP
jgi:hypothetical protein